MGRQVPQAAFSDLPWSGDRWRLIADEAALALPRTPAVLTTGNGFIGVRGPGNMEPAVYLNGVHERVPIPYHEAAHGYARIGDRRLPVADATAPAITIDGAPAGPWTRATLDMAAGLLVLEQPAAGGTLRLARLVAMDANVVAMRVSLTGTDATLEVAPAITPPPFPEIDADAPYDPRIGPDLGRSPWIADAVAADGRVDRLPESGFVVGVAATAGGTARARPGEDAVIDLFAGYAAARDGDGHLAWATRDAAAAIGFDALAARQAAWWRAWWDDADFAFPDASGAEAPLTHALFQVAQAVARDGRGSIPAKGQTGEGYEGHVFWDADSYVLPMLVHLRPDIARAMLAWRIATLPAARDNARAMGQPAGALIAWRTIAGHECSSFFPAGSAQYHINADVAHALELYVGATGDRSILDEGGAELLVETARIWLQIGFHDPARGDAFVVNRVTGPDEYSAIVDNNLYTNLMAQAHLRYAVAEGGAHLAPGEGAAMARAADAMLIPRDAARDLPSQDDRFFALEPWPFADTPADHYPLLLHYHPLAIYRRQVCKQADAVLAQVVLRDTFTQDERRRMLDVYEAVTVHDSTLSASAFASAAAGVGDAARAFSYWRASLLTDLADLFGNAGHGLHMAALAGSWTALAMGFAGMRSIGGLSFAPIAVPDLGRYAFAMRWQGRRLRVEVDDATARYTVLDGDALTLTHRGEALTLAPGETAERVL